MTSPCARHCSGVFFYTVKTKGNDMMKIWGTQSYNMLIDSEKFENDMLWSFNPSAAMARISWVDHRSIRRQLFWGSVYA